MPLLIIYSLDVSIPAGIFNQFLFIAFLSTLEVFVTQICPVRNARILLHKFVLAYNIWKSFVGLNHGGKSIHRNYGVSLMIACFGFSHDFVAVPSATPYVPSATQIFKILKSYGKMYFQVLGMILLG